MYCVKCGARIEDNARFCGKCGYPVSASSSGSKTSGSVDTTEPIIPKKKGPLAALPVLAVVLVLAAVAVFAARSSHSGTALCAGGFESAVKEAVQYASGMAGEGQEDSRGQEENENAVTRETVLGQYREFLLGNLTAEYNGNQVSFSRLYEIYCEDEYIEEEYRSATPVGMGVLIDSDTDKMPELLIDPAPGEMAYAGMCGWRLYTLYSENGELKITESASGGYMDYLTLYTNGLLWTSHGLSVDIVDWFETLQGEKLACFVDFNGYDGSENWDSIAEDARRRWLEEGYEQVYITYNGDTSGVQYTPVTFAAEYGGEEAQFYSLEEILNMLPVSDTSMEPAAEDTESPWRIQMKNCTIDVDLSACIPAEYLETVQRNTYGDALQNVVSTFYRHPEMITITQATVYDFTPDYKEVGYHIDNSDCEFAFFSEDGGKSWKADNYLINVKGSSYTGFTIIFDNGVPDNTSDLYEKCVGSDEYVENFNENKIYRTDYVMGEPILSLRDAEGNTIKIPVQ